MRRSAHIVSFILILILLPGMGWATETVKAPRGWGDQYEAQTRVVSNGNSTVRIHPWQDLLGISIEDWLTNMEQQDPRDGQLISSEGVKTESVPGAYSILRKAEFDGQEGYAILYGCPGQTGHARLMTLDVRDGSFFDSLKGAMFGEKICEKEPKGKGSSNASESPSTNTASASSTNADQDADANTSTTSVIGPGVAIVKTESAGRETSPDDKERFATITDDELKALNLQIPTKNRPTSAKKYEDWGFFGGLYSLKIRFTLLFENGVETRCANWDPIGDFPNAEKLASSRCKFPSEDLLGKVRAFKPGERVEVDYRTYEQLNSYDFADNVAYQSIGGTLKLNLDGTIGNSRSSSSYSNNSAATAASGRNTAIAGRYYLNAHTMTVLTDQGDVVHSFIGYDVDDDGKIRRIYLNGAMFWDWNRDK